MGKCLSKQKTLKNEKYKENNDNNNKKLNPIEENCEINKNQSFCLEEIKNFENFPWISLNSNNEIEEKLLSESCWEYLIKKKNLKIILKEIPKLNNKGCTVKISRSIYLKILENEKKYKLYGCNISQASEIITSMKNIVENDFNRCFNELKPENFIYQELPIKMLETFVIIYQILISFRKNLEIDWWINTKDKNYIDCLKSKFIELSGKMKFEILIYEKNTNFKNIFTNKFKFENKKENSKFHNTKYEENEK